jgi:hypothetical protein
VILLQFKRRTVGTMCEPGTTGPAFPADRGSNALLAE